jgi:hypothetical protein
MFYPKDGGDTFLRNVSVLLSKHTALQHRRPYSSKLRKLFFSPIGSTAVAGPRPLLQFRNHLFTQSVGLLGRVISPSQGHYLHTGQHEHRINLYKNIHALNGIRTHHPRVRASEDSSCLSKLGPCDRLAEKLQDINP